MIKKMKMLVASNNKGKLREFNSILGELGIECVSMADVGIDIEVEETGTTFLENARIKAEEIYKIAKIPTVSDDSGLEVDYLGGEPGVYSARYSGEHGNDEKNNQKLLENLEGIPFDKRTGRFRSVVYLVLDEHTHLYANGTAEGIILTEAKGENGFGYDPLFFSPTLGKTFAEASAKEKNDISHRGNAIRELKKKLEEIVK